MLWSSGRISADRSVIPDASCIVAPARQIGRARPRSEFLQQRVVTAIAPQPRDFRVRIVDIAEGNRLGWAGGLAGRDDVAVTERPVLLVGRSMRGLDPLRAIGAFLHDAARTHA